MQFLGFVVGLGILGMALIVGAFLLAGLLGLALIVAVAVWVRLWWLRRRASRTGVGEDDIIEAEYRIVRTRRRNGDDGQA